MSLALQYDLSESARLRNYLDRLALLDVAELASAISFEGEQQTRRRIQEEKKSPEGEAWPEWSPAYKATRHGGQSLLQSGGGLVDSIQANPEGSVAEWGSNLVYAALHNFGGEEVGINVPAREYLGLSDENLSDIEDLVIDFIDRHAGVKS